MKTLIALAAGLALLASPVVAAPVANVGGAKAVASAGSLPIETVQSRGKRIAPVGGPYRGGPPHRGGWNGGGRHHHHYHGGRGWGGGRWYGGGWGWGWGGGYWPGYYGGYYGYGAPVVVGAAPVVVAPRAVVVAPRGVVKVRRPWTRAWYRSCAKRYRSFNPRTGYYRTYSGRLVFCR